MAANRQNRPNKDHPWSWHRIFLLFALTVIMILGFVVLGGGSAMMAECEETETRRSVYLSDIVMKSNTKRELLHQVMTAWQCDIPADRLPPALTAASRDQPQSCDSDLLTQLRFGGQGTLAAGVLLVVASGGGYGGAISARRGPLAMYIVVTVVTAVLELAAVGLLVYSKSQLDSLPGQLDVLMAQPLVEEEVVVLDAPGGILTAPGEVPTVPTPASRPRPGGRSGGEAGGDSSDGDDLGEKKGTVHVTETDGVSKRTTDTALDSTTASGPEVTASSAAGVNNSTEGLQGMTEAPTNVAASSSAPTAPQTSPSPISSGPSSATVQVIESRRATTDEATRSANNASSQPSAPFSNSHSDIVPSGTANLDSIAPKTTKSQTSVLERSARRRRHPEDDWKESSEWKESEEEWEESEEEWNDHTEEVILHWSPAATDCLPHSAQRNNSHCFVQLEHNLQRELNQSELVLELMMAPLVCAFLACLLQLTTICAAWNMISDQQSRRPRPQTSQNQLSTHV